MEIYYILLILSGLVILSHLFSLISNKTKIPSVLLLIGLGVFLRSFLDLSVMGLDDQINSTMKMIGAIGLVFIVLEGSLDLSLGKSSIGIAKKALSSAFAVFTSTALMIVSVFMILVDIPLQSALAYAIPLSIISGGVAIPTTVYLSKEKREFIIYESTFSDIIGILTFGYIIMPDFYFSNLISQIFIDTIITLPFAIIFLITILLLIHFSEPKIKLIPLLAIIITVYASTKIFNLPAPLLILAFGLLLKNIEILTPKKLEQFFVLDIPKLNEAKDELKTIVIELSFLVRNFFFIIFGFTLQPGVLFNRQALLVGSIVLGIILIARLISLKYILKENFIQELLLAPRDLITVLLFFNIPEYLRIESFREGIVYFVIIASSLVVMSAFMFFHKPYGENPEMFAGN